MRPVHIVNVANGSDMPLPDQVVIAKFSAANLIGGGAGAAVVTAVVFSEPIPLPYKVHVTPDQDAVAFVNAKTALGFNLTLNPRLAASTLAVGANDILVTA
jgi:hypothetical protein